MTVITSTRCFGQIPNGSKDCRSLQPTKEGLKATAGARARSPGSRPKGVHVEVSFLFSRIGGKAQEAAESCLSGGWSGNEALQGG